MALWQAFFMAVPARRREFAGPRAAIDEDERHQGYGHAAPPVRQRDELDRSTR